MKKIVLVLALMFIASPALADDAGIPAPPATSLGDAPAAGSATPTPDLKPADKLHDPLKDPQATFDDMKAAKKLGWSVLVLTVLIMACKLLARLGGIFKRLGTGHAALVVAAVGAFSCSAYNALVLGGTWMAALAAAIVAGAAALDLKAKPPTDGAAN